MTIQPLRNFLKDPLCHFAVIGGLLFAISSLSSMNTPDQDEIQVTEQRIQHLAAIFERRWQRPPTQEELERLIDNFVREEVLYREASRLGLDQDDTVIRRRLRLKMELMAKDLVEAIEPADAVLKARYQQQIERYTQPAIYTFEQIYFNSDKRPEVAEDARLVLAKLASGGDPSKLGDSNLLQHNYRDITAERANQLFGSSFSLQLAELEIGKWQGPVTSAYGEHLVRISETIPAQVAPFETVRAEVLRDWQIEEQQEILETQYQTLRSNYRIDISPYQPEQPLARQADRPSNEVASQ